MIHFIIATHSEARPIIDLFRLKKIKNQNKVSIYSNKNMSVTITGIGKVNSAVGVIQTFYEVSQEMNNIWINLGLAGHKDKKIGEIFSVSKISDYENNKFFYPFINEFKIEYDECISLGKEKKEYNQSIFDMESSGFYDAAKKFSTKEFIQIIKVISDNESNSIEFEKKEKIYKLINKHKHKIFELCEYMKKLKNMTLKQNLKAIDHEYQSLIKNIKFTFTEKEQIKSLLNLYFSKYNSIKKNIFNINENGAYNIKQLKKYLEL